MNPNSHPTAVLVHGAFADASGFAGVIRELLRAGYRVLAQPTPLRGVATDAAAVYWSRRHEPAAARRDEAVRRALRARGLRSVTIQPLGYRATDGDWLVNLKKVRRPKDEFVSVVA